MNAKICGLIGCSLDTAGVILALLDVATAVSVIVSLTGIGFAAASTVFWYKATITAVVKTAGKQAAKAM